MTTHHHERCHGRFSKKKGPHFPLSILMQYLPLLQTLLLPIFASSQLAFNTRNAVTYAPCYVCCASSSDCSQRVSNTEQIIPLPNFVGIPQASCGQIQIAGEVLRAIPPMGCLMLADRAFKAACGCSRPVIQEVPDSTQAVRSQEDGPRSIVFPETADIASDGPQPIVFPDTSEADDQEAGMVLEPYADPVTASPTTTPTATPTATPTSVMPSDEPSATPSFFIPEDTSVPSDYPSLVPDVLSAVEISKVAILLSDYPSTVPSDVPSSTPTAVMPSQATIIGTNGAIAVAAVEEEAAASDYPSSMPSDLPSTAPSSMPSVVPNKPKKAPLQSVEEPDVLSISDYPSQTPSDLPSMFPSDVPSSIPTAEPKGMTNKMSSSKEMPAATAQLLASDYPGSIPSDAPSSVPSDIPSIVPDDLEGSVPLESAEELLSDFPSQLPSDVPSMVPSDSPSSTPSAEPKGMTNKMRRKLQNGGSSILPNRRLMGSSKDESAAVRDPGKALDVFSDYPSSMPSDAPSTVPSDIPSILPSDVPSSIPTSEPKGMTNKRRKLQKLGSNLLPQRRLMGSNKEETTEMTDAKKDEVAYLSSDYPSSMPSDAPSAVPSDIPSTVPGDMENMIAQKSVEEPLSDYPSQTPSDLPSMLPSDFPSSTPTPEPKGMTNKMRRKLRNEQNVLFSQRRLMGSNKENTNDKTNFASEGTESSLSDYPSSIPSDAPSTVPSEFPSIVPAVLDSLPSKEDRALLSVSDYPSQTPSDLPSMFPSDVPSYIPTVEPKGMTNKRRRKLQSSPHNRFPQRRLMGSSKEETDVIPDIVPVLSDYPSSMPSDAPSTVPSDIPSIVPAVLDSPSSKENRALLSISDYPSQTPSNLPSLFPSNVPSYMPNAEPKGMTTKRS